MQNTRGEARVKLALTDVYYDELDNLLFKIGIEYRRHGKGHHGSSLDASCRAMLSVYHYAGFEKVDER